MPGSLKELLAAAHAVVPAITPPEAATLMATGNVLVVDVRDAPEVQASGKIRGAVHVSRGMLELRADPDLSSHDPAFQKSKTVLVYCGSGVRAALAGRTLKDLGYSDVRNLGGFQDWVTAGGAVEKV
jgi:rhodanese-related sulfurtransferase